MFSLIIQSVFYEQCFWKKKKLSLWDLYSNYLANIYAYTTDSASRGKHLKGIHVYGHNLIISCNKLLVSLQSNINDYRY